MIDSKLTCAQCQKMACMTRDRENMPINCPSRMDDLTQDVVEQYHSDIDSMLAYESARTKIDACEPKTRLDETIDFARRCGYHTIGIAFCRMVKNDAQLVSKRLREEGFSVHSVMCRMGAISDEILEHEGEHFIHDKHIGAKGYETMCNPIGQAAVLEQAQTELNVVMGLCVGHDTLFLRHSKAPVTILGVKDRKLGCTKIF